MSKFSILLSAVPQRIKAEVFKVENRGETAPSCGQQMGDSGNYRRGCSKAGKYLEELVLQYSIASSHKELFSCTVTL